MPRSSPKARGELAGIRFLLKAACLNLVVAKPWGDNLPFDFLVGRGKRFYRVQVKSASARHCRGYHVCCFRPGGRRAYTSRDADFLAAYIVPERAWYVIPIPVLRSRKTIVVFPRRPAARGLELYREAWHLLRA